MKESAIERYLCMKVREKGGRAYKFTSPAHRGVPDRIILTSKGQTIFCEVKNEKGVLSALQKAEIKWLRDNGHNVFVVYSKEDINALLEVIDELC